MGGKAEGARAIVDQYKELRKEGKPVSEVWDTIHEKWVRKRSDRKNAEQSWKSASGAAFERIVFEEIKMQIEREIGWSAEIITWNRIPECIRKGILSDQLWSSSSPEKPTIVESKVDLVLIEGSTKEEIKSILAIYSCKTSAAERFQQDLYWAERFRERGIRFCFVTLDEKFIEYAQRETTWKKNTSKSIALARTAYDRVYLPIPIDKIKIDDKKFRSWEEMIKDIQKWREVL